MNKGKILSFVSVVLMVSLILSACGNNNEGNKDGKGSSTTIKIGAQTYSEPKILAEMYKALIEERTDISVNILTDLAASPIVIQALKDDEIQMATLYSGEVFNGYFDVEMTKDRAETLKLAQEGFDEHYDFKWFESYGFENTYAFTVRKELAEEFKLTKISDLKDRAKDMSIGVDTTWLERDLDGYRAFTKLYGFDFGKTYPMEISLVYGAVAEKEVDVVLAYSTDPGIQEFELQTLEDDMKFFPPFDASPVLRKDTLEQNPELNDIIVLLEGKIDATTMTSLNYEVDVNKRSPKEVAVEYLKSNELLK